MLLKKINRHVDDNTRILSVGGMLSETVKQKINKTVNVPT